MKPDQSSENNERDEEVIKRLQNLQASGPSYPPDLLQARRAAFLAKVDELEQADAARELAPEDQEVVGLLGRLKAAQPTYPANLLAARRAAFLQQMGRAQAVSVWERLQRSVKGLFPSTTGIPNVPSAPLRWPSLAIAVLIAAVWIGSLVFARIQQVPRFSPALATATSIRAINLGEQTLLICKPGDQRALCSRNELDSSPDLAEQGHGEARAAVSSDAAAFPASNVNDGRSDTSWVSDRPQSWIKLDLGNVRLIDSVTLKEARVPQGGNPGQFVIAVSLSDIYSDGNSSNDHAEYAQVFNSEQAGFSGSTGEAETVRAVFPAVQARFVKITFQKAGAAIDEVSVFMVRPSALTAAPTQTLSARVPGATATPIPPTSELPTQTLLPLATNTQPPTGTASSLPTETALPTLTATFVPSETASPLPTASQPATFTPTSVPIQPLPSDTLVPSATAVPPTVVPPTVSLPAAGGGPLIVRGNGQTLTLTCDGNEVEIRGQGNTVSLLGTCSRITVSGNGNSVFWEAGAPLIVNKGRDNLISQR